jgi:hypothetical protein
VGPGARARAARRSDETTNTQQEDEEGRAHVDWGAIGRSDSLADTENSMCPAPAALFAEMRAKDVTGELRQKGEVVDFISAPLTVAYCARRTARC